MSKQIIIVHGTGESPDSAWFQYVANNMTGYEVVIPALPDPAHPSVEETVPFMLESCQFTSETVLIGHSSGCPLILSLLERITTPVKQVILVAGFMSPISEVANPILQTKYQTETIKANCPNFMYINSDDDPWGCDITKGTELRETFGGTQISMTGHGHFGSMKYNQPYKEFPFLLTLIAE